MIKYNTIDQGKLCKTMLGHGGFINESLYYCSGNHVRILHMIYPWKKLSNTQSKLVDRPRVFQG